MSPPPIFASTAERAIALLGCLRQLTGMRSSGAMTVTALAGTPTVPINAFLFPVLTGSGGGKQIDYSAPMRCAETKQVSTSGTSVQVTSLLGGARHNLVAGTELVWFPSVAGVAQRAVVTAGGLTGGTDEASELGLKSVVWFEEPVGAVLAEDLLRAAIRSTPCAILSWLGTDPNYYARGNGITTRTDKWVFTIVVNRQDAAYQRGYQGLTIVDFVEAMLLDRSSIDGALISAFPIRVKGRQPINAGVNHYAYAVSFETAVTVSSIFDPSIADSSLPAGAHDWLHTQYEFPTMQSETGTHPGTLDVVRPGKYPQP